MPRTVSCMTMFENEQLRIAPSFAHPMRMPCLRASKSAADVWMMAIRQTMAVIQTVFGNGFRLLDFLVLIFIFLFFVLKLVCRRYGGQSFPEQVLSVRNVHRLGAV